MIALLVVPAILTVAAVLGSRHIPRSVSPVAAVWWLSGLTVLATLSTLGALAVIAAEGLSTVPALSAWARFGHLRHPGGHGAGLLAGVLAAGVLVVGTARAVGYLNRLARERRCFAGVEGIEVVAADGPVAFAVPGRHGGVVVGDRVLEALEADERRAVLAHELAHLRHGHHHHVRVAAICASALPYLAPVADAVRFGTERWADEVASIEIGSRRTVARAIARVALVGSTPRPAPELAFVGRGSIDRVEALLAPPATIGLAGFVPASFATLAVAAVGCVQLVHQASALVSHLWS